MLWSTALESRTSSPRDGAQEEGAEAANPPNLRIQPAVHGPMCRFCTSMVRSQCTKYGVNVEPYAQCDSFDSIFLKGARQIAEP
jgi:hypothetical protein